MKVKLLGRKVNLKQNFIDMAEKRLHKLDKFFGDDAECQVTVTVEKDWQTTEVTVHSKGFIYRAEKSAPDMETAFSDAVDLLTKQIVRNKEKLGTRVKRTAVDETAQAMGNLPEEEYVIAREKRFSAEPMSVEDAILQMNMLGHSFFIFRDAQSDELKLVYRRHDDAYGLLIPEL